MSCQELDWINKACAGDTDAFAHLVECYQLPVYNLAYRLLGDKMEAEDAAQETFLRAFAGLSSYQCHRSFSTWLLSITAHICIDQLRHNGLLKVEMLGDRALSDDTLDPETVTLQHERTKTLQTVLQHLPPHYRQLIHLRYWNELSYHEMSQVTGITENAVKSRLHRARHVLARMLRPTDIPMSAPQSWALQAA